VCGIAGVLSADQRGVEPAVRAMMRAMIHRGPDDEGYEELPLGGEGGPVAGFGFRRLTILDLTPAGHQPMVNLHTGDCLIFNGEIYNFRWLRAKLESKGLQIRSSGDTEVLLHALATWGEAALDTIDGMYAFAFYHAASRRILLARDPFGIKPLYVAALPRAFIFASEVRTVLASGLVPDDLDPAGMATMLAYGAPQDPLTVHAAIKSFPAGACQWIDAGVAAGHTPPTPRRYWRFPDVVQNVAEEDAVRKITLQLNASVRDQCISDVPIGAFLSGGIDSATLAAIAVRHSPGLHTYAVGFESDRAADETAAAAETAHAIGSVHSQTILDDEWGSLLFHGWLKSADRPSIDGLNTYVVSEVVKNRGVTVALSGIGADELFGGYAQFRGVPKLRRWLGMAGFIPAGMRQTVARLLLSRMPRSKREKAIDLISARPTALDLALAMRRILFTSDLNRLGLSARGLGLSPAYLPQAAYELLGDLDADDFRTISRAECVFYMGNTLLRDADVNSMAHSLEVRVPFLGRTISETASSFPGSLQAPRGAAAKHLLRQAMQKDLPTSVFERRKVGFTLPIGEWMTTSCKDLCQAAIDSLASCSLIDGDGVRAVWESFAGPTSANWYRRLGMVAMGSYLQRSRSDRRFAA
jgi:asparagine synthase (glutamine-hydrolysing)